MAERKPLFVPATDVLLTEQQMADMRIAIDQMIGERRRRFEPIALVALRAAVREAVDGYEFKEDGSTLKFTVNDDGTVNIVSKSTSAPERPAVKGKLTWTPAPGGHGAPDARVRVWVRPDDGAKLTYDRAAGRYTKTGSQYSADDSTTNVRTLHSLCAWGKTWIEAERYPEPKTWAIGHGMPDPEVAVWEIPSIQDPSRPGARITRMREDEYRVDVMSAKGDGSVFVSLPENSAESINATLRGKVAVAIKGLSTWDPNSLGDPDPEVSVWRTDDGLFIHRRRGLGKVFYASRSKDTSGARAVQGERWWNNAGYYRYPAARQCWTEVSRVFDSRLDMKTRATAEEIVRVLNNPSS